MNSRLTTHLATIGLTVLGLAACSPGAPTDAAPLESAEPAANPIIGGSVDKGDPSVVLMKAESGNSGWWCTGSVIAKRLVLTAAHCVEEADGGTKMRVMFGPSESSGKASDYIAVTEWHHDPGYMATNNIAAGHDAAVLILAQDAPVAPLAINHAAMTTAMVGSPVHVVGYGNDNGQAGTGAGTKREIFTQLHSLEQGVANVGRPGQTTCQGDSGGPSFMKIGGQDVIVGITSYGEQGCVDYGSVTRVDLSAAWIDPYITANGGGGGGGGKCTPTCSGRVCGDDGCGGVCGACASGSSCTSAGQCEAKPPPPPPPPSGGCAESEPNDQRSSANALCAAGVMTGTISTAYDSDWYTWKVPAKATYTLDLTTPHEYVMTLYKVVNGSLYEITSAFDEIQKQTPDGGVYYLEVWGGNGDYSPSDEYSMSVAIK